MKIVCFTGSRAEYYLLRPLFIELNKRSKYNLFLIVSGGILEEESKQTIKDIRRDKINICGEINLKGFNSNHANSIGKICIDSTKLIFKMVKNPTARSRGQVVCEGTRQEVPRPSVSHCEISASTSQKMGLNINRTVTHRSVWAGAWRS